MSEMVSRVELAISQAAYPDVHPDFTDAGWRRMAEAAIAAMREPTAEMVDAAEEAYRKSGRLMTQFAPELIYTAMISALLESEAARLPSRS